VSCRWFLSVVLIVALSVWPALAKQEFSFSTEDSVTIFGTFFEPSSKPAPVLLLLHMLGQDRSSWDGFAKEAN
jgi:hypothetical protein